MNKDIAKKWVDALRSGEYKQGKGYLKNAAGEYCCLGVLCEVVGEKFTLFQGEPSYRCGINSHNLYLPPEIVAKAGLRTSNGFISKSGTYAYSNLADMNDNCMSFEYIADVIEKEVEKL